MVGMKHVASGGGCLLLGAAFYGGGFGSGWFAYKNTRAALGMGYGLSHQDRLTNDTFTPPSHQNSAQSLPLPKNLTTPITITPTAPTTSNRTALPVGKTAGSRRPTTRNRNKNANPQNSPFKAASTQPDNTQAIRRTGAKIARRFKA